MKKLFSILHLILPTFCFAQIPSTWVQVPVPTTRDLHSIVFPSPQVGYIGGADSVLLKTTDGGQSWTKVNYTGINFLPGGDDFMALDFITNEIGYATVGPYTGTYRTADGGQTWTQLNTTPSLCYNHTLYFLADGEGFVGGSGCFQGEQMDRFVLPGNSNPVSINSPSFNAQNLIVDIDFDLEAFASVGIAVSKGGRILRTTDGGNNWDTLPSPLGNQVPLTTVTIVRSNLAFIGYDNGSSGLALLVSTNGGLSWSIDTHSGTFAYPIFHDLHTTSNKRVYCGTTSTSLNKGYIMELPDANASTPFWMGYPVEKPIYSMTSHSDTVVWGAGKNGYVVKREPAGVLSTDSKESPISMHVFPNPAQNRVRVDFPTQPWDTNFYLELYSTDGRRLKKGAENENEMTLGDIENGIYLLRYVGRKSVLTTKLIKDY